MILRLVLAAAVLLLVPAAAARADTFVITSVDWLDGSLVVDTATGTLISSALTYRGESFPIISDIGGNLGPFYFTLFSVGYWDVVEVVLQTGSLQGYRGGPFYMDFWGYPAYPTGGFSETYGVLTDVSQPSSVTPEAPGLLLLGTGLLGAIAVARGRTRTRGC